VATPSSNYQFAFNGWLFGGAGQGVQVLSVNGLESQPDLRVQDDIRGYLDGYFSGRDFLNGRTVHFTLQVMNDANGSMQTYLAQLKSYLTPQQTGTGSLQFILPGRSLQLLNARVRKREVVLDHDYVYGRSIAQVELFCPDPRIYDNASRTLSLTPSSGLGRVYDRIYNLVYNTGVAGNSGTATNDGNTTTFPTFTITGSCVNPVVLNSTTGAAISFVVTMGGNDVLVIDPELRSVTLNGVSARNLLLNSSTWWGLPPGSTTIGFSAQSNAGATLTASWRNAYI